MENDIIKRAWPDWEIEGDEEIGSGAFGKVYEVVHRYHGVTQRAAVKVISIPSDPSELDALRDKYDTEAIKAIFKETLI